MRSIQEINDTLDVIVPRGRIATNPIGAFQVQLNPATKGATASFTVADLTGIGTVILKRNFSLDPGSASVLNTWNALSLTEGAMLSFDDNDPSIAQNQNVYYWVDLIPVIDSEDVLIGPQKISNLSDQSPSGVISDFDASHEALSGGTVAIGISFKSPGGNFGSCKIYVSGYLGIATFQAIAQNATSPFSFPLSQTGESITLKAIAVSNNGIEQSSGPTKALTLGTTATVPAKIIGETATEISTGVQIGFPRGAESNITQYGIYRAVRGTGFGSASNIGTVAPTGASSYTFLDSNGLTGLFEWYVVATNAIGNSSASDAAVTAQASFTSADQPANVPTNATNTATVDSIDAGSNATVRIYGSGGVGTNYTRISGYNASDSRTFGTITGLAYITTYYIMRAAGGGAFQTQTTFSGSVPDALEFVGKVTTVAAGGGGGTGGGGGSGGGTGGCVEVGTPVELPNGATVEEEIIPNWEWIEVDTPEGVLAMHPDTLVSVFIRAKDLRAGDRVETRQSGNFFICSKTRGAIRPSQKVCRTVIPDHIYYARGVRLHNMKFA